MQITLSRIGGERSMLALIMAAMMSLLLMLPSLPAAAQGDQRDPAYAEFYDALDPHGEWVRHPRYGYTWVPFANDDREWRPYARGQWAYTEEHGWYWESEEEFGWVVYHYGRWLLDDRRGWMWVPGREWGPAWVAWREGEEAIGWAPLPPEAELDDGGQLTYEAYASPRYAPMWMFVAPALLTMPAIYRHFHPRTRAAFYFGQTRHATFYGYRDRRIYNRGIDRRFIEHHARRPVPVVVIRPAQGPRDVVRRPGEGGDRRPISIYRPEIAPRHSPIGPNVPTGIAPRHVPTPRDAPNHPVEPVRRPPFGGEGPGTMPPRPQPPAVFPPPTQLPPVTGGPRPQPGFGGDQPRQPQPGFGGDQPRQPRPPVVDDRRPGGDPSRPPNFNPQGPVPGMGGRPPVQAGGPEPMPDRSGPRPIQVPQPRSGEPGPVPRPPANKQPGTQPILQSPQGGPNMPETGGSMRGQR